MSLSGQTFFRKDFRGQNLSKQDLSNSKFICCNFGNADLSHANCRNSDFTGSSMRKTRCTFTDFAHSCLACIFEPSDGYGMTLTMHCRTFTGMRISKMWWYGYMYFALLMQPEKDKGNDLREPIIAAIGPERYEKLKTLFKRNI